MEKETKYDRVTTCCTYIVSASTCLLASALLRVEVEIGLAVRARVTLAVVAHDQLESTRTNVGPPKFNQATEYAHENHVQPLKHAVQLHLRKPTRLLTKAHTTYTHKGPLPALVQYLNITVRDVQRVKKAETPQHLSRDIGRPVLRHRPFPKEPLAHAAAVHQLEEYIQVFAHLGDCGRS